MVCDGRRALQHVRGLPENVKPSAYGVLARESL